VTHHIMLDLETMGKGPEAAIASIGAVEVLVDDGYIGREFYAPVDLQSAMDAGAKADGSTILWWLKQSAEARAALDVENLPLHQTNIHMVLDGLSNWFRSIDLDKNSFEVWGNGATFDNVILTSAYHNDRLLPRPWGYRGDRCYRTLKNLFPYIKCPDVGTKHHALDDAKAQGLHLISLLRAARGDTWRAFAA
jgi:hypothetical protein